MSLFPAEPIDPGYEDFRQCPVCRRPSGRACIALNGRVVDGRPDGMIVLLPLEQRHKARRPRVPRRRR